MHAIILAAGKGTRLLPLTKVAPKPLINIHNKSLLERVLQSLPERIDNITIVISYLGEQIKREFGDRFNGIPIKYVKQPELNGTGGALELFRNEIIAPTLILNADDIYQKSDLEQLVKHKHAILALKTVETVKHPLRVDFLRRFRGFKTSPNISGRSWVNCGAYVIDSEYVSYEPTRINVRGNNELSLPHTLAKLAKDHWVHVVRASFWMPVGTHEELAAAKKYLGDEEEFQAEDK